MIKTVYGKPAETYLGELFPALEVIRSDRFHKLNPKIVLQDYSVKDIDQADRFMLVKQLLERENADRVLIFCSEGGVCQDLARYLSEEGVPAQPFHSKQTDSERADMLYSFDRSETVCLVCTDLACRGIDFKGVKLVVQFDYAENGISLLHRLGRTGRMDTEGKGSIHINKSSALLMRNTQTCTQSSGKESRKTNH
jgi:superfamily II DNA/RNA helicase